MQKVQNAVSGLAVVLAEMLSHFQMSRWSVHLRSLPSIFPIGFAVLLRLMRSATWWAVSPDSPGLAEFDRIIIGLGAVPSVTPIPDIDGENVAEVFEVHLEPSKIEGDKIIVAGGGVSSCKCALELGMAGKDVTIVEMLPELCPTELVDDRNPLLFRLRDYGVKQMTSTTIGEVTAEGIRAEGPDGEVYIPADTVIASFGMKSNNALVDAICEKYPTTAVIGDCISVGQVGEAVRGGFFAGWSIH